MSRDARLIDTTEIALDQIEVDARLRPVSEKAVAALRVSIEALGLQAEIHVRKVAHKNGALRLIAGGHRVAVFKAMGRETIPAKVWDCTDDWAALAEIDDNLAHAELDALELAVFLAERKAVYERMHPETKVMSGAALAAKRWNAADNLSTASFVAATADKMGVSDRNVRRLVAAGQGLDKTAIEMLRTAPKKVTLADLQALAKCQPDDRPVICRELSLGKAKSAKEVLDRRKEPGAARASASEAELNKLQDAYARASKKTRKRFFAAHLDELRAFLEEHDAEAGPVTFKARGRD